MRRIIQSDIVKNAQGDQAIVAFCEDGTLWSFSLFEPPPNNVWRPFPTIPDGSVENGGVVAQELPPMQMTVTRAGGSVPNGGLQPPPGQ